MDREQLLLKLKNNPEYIQELDNPCEELEVFVVKNNGNNIKYIKNPSKEVQRQAIKNTPLCVKYIKNVMETLAVKLIFNFCAKLL